MRRGAPGQSTTMPTTTAAAKGISTAAITLRRCFETGAAGPWLCEWPWECPDGECADDECPDGECADDECPGACPGECSGSACAWPAWSV